MVKIKSSSWLMSCLIILLACGSSSPTETPLVDEPIVLETYYGSMHVATNGHTFNPEKARDAVELGFARGIAQVPKVAEFRIDFYTLEVMPSTWVYYGEHVWDERLIRSRVGVEGVLNHELQHAFCHMLGHSGECCRLQDHPGGYDLKCQPL